MNRESVGVESVERVESCVSVVLISKAFSGADIPSAAEASPTPSAASAPCFSLLPLPKRFLILPGREARDDLRHRLLTPDEDSGVTGSSCGRSAPSLSGEGGREIGAIGTDDGHADALEEVRLALTIPSSTVSSVCRGESILLRPLGDPLDWLPVLLTYQIISTGLERSVPRTHLVFARCS